MKHEMYPSRALKVTTKVFHAAITQTMGDIGGLMKVMLQWQMPDNRE